VTINTILVALLATLAYSYVHAETFTDNFNSLNRVTWEVSDGDAPGEIDSNRSEFDPDNVSIIDGYLRLRVVQTPGDGQIRSSGAEISTSRDFGYGVYEFRMRTSTTSQTPLGEGESLSGGVSAAFVYAPKAITEIDIEFESNQNRKITHLLTWEGESKPNEHTQAKLPDTPSYETFYTYKMVWTEAGVSFYRDDVLIGHHDGVVPQTPGRMMFNHWGTNSKWWGGAATLNAPRYVYIDWFRFTPLK